MGNAINADEFTYPLGNRETKGKQIESQLQKVFKCLSEEPKTMLQAARECKVLRSNITWFIDQWRKSGKVWKVKTDHCPLTGCKAGFYTTSKSIADKFSAIQK